MRDGVSKGLVTGVAGGLVVWWAIDRFYKLARENSATDALTPFCAGAALGVAYGGSYYGATRALSRAYRWEQPFTWPDRNVRQPRTAAEAYLKKPGTSHCALPPEA
jgi:hypothetical protein